jgi:hypothetical protein
MRGWKKMLQMLISDLVSPYSQYNGGSLLIFSIQYSWKEDFENHNFSKNNNLIKNSMVLKANHDKTILQAW